jgi:hypothetical protein
MGLLVAQVRGDFARSSREVWLTYSLAGQEDRQVDEQFRRYQGYTNRGALTHASVSMYCIKADGTFDTTDRGTDRNESFRPQLSMTSSQFQQQLKGLGLKAVPTLRCGSGKKASQDLAEGLKIIFKDSDIFIGASIKEAKALGWDGYAVDIEPNEEIEKASLTQLMVEWGARLREVGMSLSIFTRAGMYDLSIIGDAGNVTAMLALEAPSRAAYALEYTGEQFIKQIGSPHLTGFSVGSHTWPNQPRSRVNQLMKFARESMVKALSFEASLPDNSVDFLWAFLSAEGSPEDSTRNQTAASPADEAPQLRGSWGSSCGCATWGGEVCVCNRCCASWDSWCKHNHWCR